MSLQALINRSEAPARASGPLLTPDVGVTAYEKQLVAGIRAKSTADSVSFALSALVNVSGEHITPEELASLITELSRIANDLSCDRDLKGVDKVVELLDNAHDAAESIGQGLTTCGTCAGSGEGRHDGARCLPCGGAGEVMA